MAELNQKTVELRLPETESTVVMSEFLTIGQSRQLQRMILSSGKFDSAAGTISDVSADAFMDMQDKAAELLVREIKEKDGSTHPFSIEWLGNLPVKDGQILYEKVNQLTQESNMSATARKN